MNTSFHLLARIMLIGLSLSFRCAFAVSGNQAVSTEGDTSGYLYIEGTIVVENKDVKGSYILEIVYFDSVINTITVKNNRPVKLLLKRDEPYTLRISKKGYIARNICLNTSTPDVFEHATTLSFYFETDFIKIPDALCLDSEALNLPVAIIAFNRKSGNFVNNRDYSLFVRQKLYAGQGNSAL